MAARQGISSSFRTPQRNLSSTPVVRSADISTPRRTDTERLRRTQFVPGTSPAHDRDETQSSE